MLLCSSTNLPPYRQERTETFDVAWERYQNLLYSYPHHKFTNSQILEYFISGLVYEDRRMLLTASNGRWSNLEVGEALELICNIAQGEHEANLLCAKKPLEAAEVDPLKNLGKDPEFVDLQTNVHLLRQQLNLLQNSQASVKMLIKKDQALVAVINEATSNEVHVITYPQENQEFEEVTEIEPPFTQSNNEDW